MFHIYKCPVKHWTILVLLTLTLVNPVTNADDLALTPAVYTIPSFLNVDYGNDSEQSRDYFIFANLGISASHRVSAGYGEHDEIVRGSLEELDTKTYVLGYTFYSRKQYHIGADIEYWGEDNKLTTDTYSLFVSFDVSDFTFTFSPQYREISVFTDAGCSGDLSNTALALDAKYFFNRNWSFNLGYASFDYSIDLDKVLECDVQGELPILVARLKSVADDNQFLAGANFYFNTETISLDWIRVESALDGDFTYITSVYAATDYFDSWTFALTAGTQENYDDTTTDFIKGSVTYYW